jgi:uncharacterized protein YbjT (DUF2867 family)
LLTFADLASTKLYKITVPTRDPTSEAAQELLTFHDTHLIQASYVTQHGLRASFDGQDAVFFNMNSFALREPEELYWTIRAYEIAASSGVKHFVFSGTGNRLAQHEYKEEFRNAHNAVAGHLTSWLEAQPTTQMAWTTITGGVYMEMLSSLLRPIRAPDGTFVFAAPIGSGSVPFALLDDYGALVAWVLSHPEQSIGKRVSGAPFVTTWPELAASLTEATGKRAVFRDLTADEWFEGLSSYINPDVRMPKGAAEDDESATTFRKSFSAWWNLWKYNPRDTEREQQQQHFMQKINPGRPLSIADWMKRTGYTGEFQEALKMRKDDE